MLPLKYIGSCTKVAKIFPTQRKNSDKMTIASLYFRNTLFVAKDRKTYKTKKCLQLLWNMKQTKYKKDDEVIFFWILKIKVPNHVINKIQQFRVCLLNYIENIFASIQRMYFKFHFQVIYVCMITAFAIDFNQICRQSTTTNVIICRLLSEMYWSEILEAVSVWANLCQTALYSRNSLWRNKEWSFRNILRLSN